MGLHESGADANIARERFWHQRRGAAAKP